MGGVGSRSKFAGRAREHAQLQAALQDVVAGSGRLILIAGEPGIGKTRTAEELAREARERGANVAWGRCWGEAGAPDLWPWMQVIRTCIRSVDEDTLRQLVGPHGSELTALVTLSGSESDAPTAAVSPASRFRLFNAIAHFLDAYSARAPLVVILEDLHRADAPTLLLLQFFTQEQRQRRILLIGTYREPGAPPHRALTQAVIEAMREPGSERLTLASLTEEESALLLRALLDEDVPSDLIQTLHRRTGGNPLFLTECARLLADRDAQGTRVWKSAGDLPIPGELREMLEQRLETLSTEHRGVLARAAVHGDNFQLEDLVSTSAPDDRHHVKAAFAEAESLGLMRPGGTPGTYRFAQEMMREWLAGEAPVPVPATPPPNVDPTPRDPGVSAPASTIFRREGEYWTIAYKGHTSRVKDAKGLAYVAILLRQPHVEVHVSELVNLEAGSASPANEPADPSLGPVRLGLGDAGVVIDAQAKAAYRTRLEELRGELFEAETFHDTGRAERLRGEIDFLTQELVSATGLGGRDRRVGSDTERARVNITRAIVRALARIDENDPELGRHLRRTIRTGIFCAYTPDASVAMNWER